MRKIAWRLARAVLILVATVLAIPLLGLAYGFATTDDPVAKSLTVASEAPPQEFAQHIRAQIPGYQRPEESTWLTYPEWAIVYAAREYAGFVAEGRESSFPYWAYIGLFWQDYATVIRASSDHPFNFSNHLMLVVIGTSHTVEHAIQSIYENTFGRVTELLSGEPAPEDLYQAKTAGEYAAFLDQVPWYRFPYADKRAGLWEVEAASGLGAIRSWERKAAFGLSYTIKQAYADLIASGLAATSDPALLDIHVWAKGPVAQAIAGEPDTVLEKNMGADGAVFVTKRYQVFTEMIPRLIEKGVSFVEIGGNDEIFVTVLSAERIDLPQGADQLFAYPLPAEPGIRRTGFTAAVTQLDTVLPALATGGARLEHVYDY